ncbi:DUF4123 domain-containing protein [Thiocystis violascens]|uniref:DUF4123 domain-containing protein n=1 Tax=Thiocystis violascens (strain ATCC 17096 / DSM 198 / 6111) TaxID=765911 RepID=I3YB75_THIV6|nr:DUF4123 domain-containing protein [Thiocystis violascens]AFL74243.1 hypothetical protein Thivi_2296 [Thiocystis violascens DSM 198]
MIDKTQVQALQASLSEVRQPLYAVLDGASIPHLPALFSEHGVPNVCLLPGELDPELAQAAPYLAQLTAESSFTELFLTHGLGRHWGILATSSADFRTQRMHFRQLVSVWDPTGKPLYFRYYDPRVLRVYLPTCNGDELRAVFGPVSAYYAEDESPDTLTRFILGGDRLGQQRLTLSGSPSLA